MGIKGNVKSSKFIFIEENYKFLNAEYKLYTCITLVEATLSEKNGSK